MVKCNVGNNTMCNRGRIIIGSDRRPETKQGIEGKIDRFRSGRVRDRVRVKFRSPI